MSAVQLARHRVKPPTPNVLVAERKRIISSQYETNYQSVSNAAIKLCAPTAIR
jgi:hypothetical protein